MRKSIPPKPLVMIILDGWGHREATDNNAIAAANTPIWDGLLASQPHTLLQASGENVGLPPAQMGNSEVGHMNIGAGRVVYQTLTRIDQAINNGRFFENEVLIRHLKHLKATNRALHLLGLISDSGVHSHLNHILSVITLAKQLGLTQVYIHAFLDGRDCAPKSAAAFIEKLNTHCQTHSCGRIASIIGRYYAMDRNQNWDRTELAYHLIMTGQHAYQAFDAHTALQEAYARGETDEFVKATSIVSATGEPVIVSPGDGFVFMNFRADRARQLTRALTKTTFNEFERNLDPQQTTFISLTPYADDIPCDVVFPTLDIHDTLGEVLAKAKIPQLRLAETEKYAHVTFFFNGGRNDPFPLETRQLIPSPDVATYDLQPSMSAKELTDALIKAINEQHYGAIICNFANADMVGHTGNFAATVKAIECLDCCLGRIQQALATVGGEALISADHGNAEQMYNEPLKQAHTAHTVFPIPLVYMGQRACQMANTIGQLSDIAPTFLYLMGLPIPKAMTGQSLLTLSKQA